LKRQSQIETIFLRSFLLKTLIKDAFAVLWDRESRSGTLQKASVLLNGNKIAAIDPAVHTPADCIVDGLGLYLLPGIIDDQVHFREPGLTHKEDLRHASRACAAGGITSFLEMPNTIPPSINQQRLDEKLGLAARESLVNFGFYIGATAENLSDLRAAKRTPGIKIFIGSSTGDLLVDDQAALEKIFSETTLPICAHCEDEATVRANASLYQSSTNVADHSRIRDSKAAVIATERAIELATRYRHPFHVLHVSTAEEIPLIASAPEWITAEVCPHHLFFSVEDYQRLGSLIKMNPSVKSTNDNEALWQALLDGTITVIATDHAPHTLKEKALPFPACPSGLPAVENALALMLNQVHLGRCTLEQVAKWMSFEPARIWRMPGKGKIEVGADADLVLVDMNRTRVIRNEEQFTKCKWSPWHGTELTGWPVATWVMGRQVFDFRAERPSFDESVRGTEIEFRS
jgi:dihydroorotase